VKHGLQQQIAQFTAQPVPIAALYRVGDFVSLFNGIGGDAGEILLDIPGASRIWIAQPRHDRDEPGQPTRGVVDKSIVSHCSAFVVGVARTLTRTGGKSPASAGAGRGDGRKDEYFCQEETRRASPVRERARGGLLRAGAGGMSAAKPGVLMTGDA